MQQAHAGSWERGESGIEPDPTVFWNKPETEEWRGKGLWVGRWGGVGGGASSGIRGQGVGGGSKVKT